MRAVRHARLGRYELLMELGRGGMAELFLGFIQGPGGFERLVAIKRILPQLAHDPQFKELFLNEGRLAAKVMHQNICDVYELGEVDGELYLVMEYLDGVSWDHVIAATPPGRDTLRLTAAIVAQACEGLHRAHTVVDLDGKPTPIIHRDVSPQNVFITADGTCKVLDFGVSKMMTDGPRTRTGVLKGKLPYMAPEQIRGEELDARADVFSLGVCAWEALAGRRLFDRETDFQIWKAITEQDVPFVRTYWPECPPLVDDVIRRALDRNPDHRPRTARDFGQALASAAGLADTGQLAFIAETLRTRCGERLEQRRQEVRAVLANRGLPSDTLRDGDMRLRSEARRVERVADREAASTVDALPRSQPAPRTRSPVLLMIVIALVAAGLAGGIVAFVMSRDRAEPVTHVEPDADTWGVGQGLGSAGEDLRRGLEDVRKAGEELRKLRDQFHRSN